MTSVQLLGAALLWLVATLVVWGILQGRAKLPTADQLWPDGEPEEPSDPIPVSFSRSAAKGGAWRAQGRIR